MSVIRSDCSQFDFPKTYLLEAEVPAVARTPMSGMEIDLPGRVQMRQVLTTCRCYEGARQWVGNAPVFGALFFTLANKAGTSCVFWQESVKGGQLSIENSTRLLIFDLLSTYRPALVTKKHLQIRSAIASPRKQQKKKMQNSAPVSFEHFPPHAFALHEPRAPTDEAKGATIATASISVRGISCYPHLLLCSDLRRDNVIRMRRTCLNFYRLPQRVATLPRDVATNERWEGSDRADPGLGTYLLSELIGFVLSMFENACLKK